MLSLGSVVPPNTFQSSITLPRASRHLAAGGCRADHWQVDGSGKLPDIGMSGRKCTHPAATRRYGDGHEAVQVPASGDASDGRLLEQARLSAVTRAISAQRPHRRVGQGRSMRAVVRE
jgi:hypothetical protein